MKMIHRATPLEKICKDLGLWAAAIMVLQNDYLVATSTHNLPEDWKRIKNPIDSDSLNAQVFRTGEPVILDGLKTDSIAHAHTKHPMTALAVLPIVKNGLVCGTLELIADKEGFKFDLGALAQIDPSDLLD